MGACASIEMAAGDPLKPPSVPKLEDQKTIENWVPHNGEFVWGKLRTQKWDERTLTWIVCTKKLVPMTDEDVLKYIPMFLGERRSQTRTRTREDAAFISSYKTGGYAYQSVKARDPVALHQLREYENLGWL